MQHPYRYIWLFLVGMMTMGIYSGCQCESAEKYKVLLIQSYDQGYVNADRLVEGARDYFDDQGIEVDLKVAYLDCEIKNADEEIGFLNKLMDSYRDDPVDLIIVCDDQATYSLLATKHPSTYKVPIVFCGVDYFDRKLLEGHSNITGLMLWHDFAHCIKLARNLFNIKYVYFLTDSTFLGKQFLSEFEYQLSEVKDSVIVEYLNATSVRSKNLIWKLNTAKPNSVIIIPRYDNIYPVFSSKASAPVFVMSNEAFNANIFYGYIVNDKKQTKEAAELGLEILRGKAPQDIPLAYHDQEKTFNWSQLKKWNIDEKSLPVGSVIVNIPWMERYKYYIILGCLLAISLVIYLVGLYIKEHRQKRNAQKKLIRQRNEFDITLSSLSEGVISVNCDGKVFGINKKALNYLHNDNCTDSCIGKDIHLLIGLTNSRNKTFCLGELIDSVKADKKSYEFPDDTFLTFPDRPALPVSGEVTPIFKDDDLYGVVIVFRDMSSEYTQREYLGLTFNESKVYPWQYDVESRVISYGNDVLRGGRGANLSLWDIEKSIHPDDVRLWKEFLQDILEGKKKKGICQFRANYQKKGYEWWEYRFSSIPATFMVPPSKIFGICVNVENLKKREEELVQARDLAAKTELKQSFLANMSHEIRTPLNAIVGFSNLLVDQDDVEEEDKKEFVRSINKNCEILLKLVSDILELSRIDSGNMSFKLEDCDITALIEEIHSNISIIIPEGIGLKKELPEFPVCLHTDPLRLTQVLTNFLNNAIKFTHKGTITIGCVTEEKGFVDIYVEDTGKGIPEDEQVMVFERFYKSDEFAQGTGLGLSICKIIVENLGGTIHLRSKEGIGSRFIVRMPY